MMRVVALGLLMLLAACKEPATRDVQQGISGEVWWLEGDFMPRIDDEPGGKRIPVQRKIVIYPVLVLENLGGQTGPLFDTLPAGKIAEVTSGEDGKFEIHLPPGTYSIFTREPEGYFANSFDGQGQINAVVVKKGEITHLVIDINYQATY